MNIHDPNIATPKVTTGPLAGSRKIYAHARCGARPARAAARDRARPSSGEPPLPVYDTTGPYTDPDVAIDVEQGLPRTRTAWVKERGGVEEYEGRPIKPVDNGNVSGKHLARAFPHYTAAAARARRQAGDATRIGARRHHHQGDDLRRRAREPRPQGAARARGSGARRRRELRRRGAAVRDAGIRARRGRARPRHHPLQHQPRRARADDHRPQLPHQDQRQYRQLGGHLLGRGGGREDGVGDPLGRRHGDGPLHRPQHPQHARMDHPQRADPDRHRADLPGAGEGRRRSGQARLGVLQGHADRAVRAGRRLFHHPRRRAARLRPPHRQPRHRHRLARRLDHGEVVPGAAQGELPLRALRRDLRHHAQVRRVVLARRRPAPRLDRRRQRPRAVRRAGDAGRAHPDRLEEGLPGDDRRPRPRAAAQDQDQHGQAAQGVRRGAVLHAWARSPPTSRRATTTSPRASAPP